MNFQSPVKALESISSFPEWFLFHNVVLYNTIFLLFFYTIPFLVKDK